MVASRAWWLSYILVWIGLAWARGKTSNSQSRDHLSRISRSISEVYAKHRGRFQSPAHRVFYRDISATVLRGGEKLYPTDPLAAKGEIGRSTFTFDDPDFEPAAAKECQMNINVTTFDRCASNEPTLAVEEGVDGERGYAQTVTSSSLSKLTAQEDLKYGQSRSIRTDRKSFVGMAENQELKNGNKEEHDKVSAHRPFDFPRPSQRDNIDSLPTYQVILKCVCHDDRVPP